MLTQSFHDWLPTILAALKPTSTIADVNENGQSSALLEKADAMAPAWWDAEGEIGRVASDVDERSVPSVSVVYKLVSPSLLYGTD